jgi:hypothetical protein
VSGVYADSGLGQRLMVVYAGEKKMGFIPSAVLCTIVCLNHPTIMKKWTDTISINW